MLKIRDSKNAWHEWKLGQDLNAATKAALLDVAVYGDEGAAFRVSGVELALIGQTVLANSPNEIAADTTVESTTPAAKPFAGKTLVVIQYYGSTPHPAYFQENGQNATFEPVRALKFDTRDHAQEYMLANGLGQPWHAVPYQF